jgi:broad specificity phosphatase PhoE
MAIIYLIRHGQASFGAEDYDRLSELGRRQSQVLGEYFRGAGVVFDAVYSGDLLRQRETARLALDLGGEDTYKFYEPIYHCSVSKLFYSSTRVSLSSFNDRSFLQVLGAHRGENLVSYR